MVIWSYLFMTYFFNNRNINIRKVNLDCEMLTCLTGITTNMKGEDTHRLLGWQIALNLVLLCVTVH